MALEQKHIATCNKSVYKQLLSKRKILEALDNTKIQKDVMFLKQKQWGKIPSYAGNTSMEREGKMWL